MQREPSNSELDLCRRLLLSGERIDGRLLLEARPFSLYPGVNGSTEVFLGQTHICIAISSSIVEPPPQKRNEGLLTIRLDFGIPPNNPSSREARERAREVTRALEKAIKGSKAIDTEALVIKTGSFVWEIVVEIAIITDGGNLLDAAHLGVMAALLIHQHPIAEMQGDEVHIIEGSSKRFALNHVPLLLTFSILQVKSDVQAEDEEIAVYDPTVLSKVS